MAPLAALLISGCVATVPVKKDDAFAYAVEAVQTESYAAGAGAAWNFLDASDTDDPRHDRGLRLLARSTEGLGLSWASGMIYRDIAQSRRNMELVPDALKGLERIVSGGVHDRDTLVTSFVASEEFGFLPADSQAFVDFHKGLDLARRGADDWANVQFAKLPPGSAYADEADYVRAVLRVAEGDYGTAIDQLQELRFREGLAPRLLQDVERTLARLAFEEQRFEDALVHFETLRERAPDDPEILLEMAWTHYYLGDSRKTLGLLIALDAPVHHDYISPERYLLEALALRRLCQFGAAREAATRLEQRYAESLEALRGGALPGDIAELRAGARLRGRSHENGRFLDQLAREKASLPSLRLEPGLLIYLSGLYARGVDEASRREEELIGRDLEDLTEELLASREGVRLIVHELGVSLLRGRRRPVGPVEQAAVTVPITGDRVLFPFSGEYWTDELDDLVVIAEDRCID